MCMHACMHALYQAMSPNWNHDRCISLEHRGTIRFRTSGHECQPPWFPPAPLKEQYVAVHDNACIMGMVQRRRLLLHRAAVLDSDGIKTRVFGFSGAMKQQIAHWNTYMLHSNGVKTVLRIRLAHDPGNWMIFGSLLQVWQSLQLSRGSPMNPKLIRFFAGHGGMVPSCKSHKKRTGAHRPNTTHPVQ